VHPASPSPSGIWLSSKHNPRDFGDPIYSPVQSQAHIQGQFYCWSSCWRRSNSSTQYFNSGQAKELQGERQAPLTETHCLRGLVSNSSRSPGVCCRDSKITQINSHLLACASTNAALRRGAGSMGGCGSCGGAGRRAAGSAWCRATSPQPPRLARLHLPKAHSPPALCICAWKNIPGTTGTFIQRKVSV